MTNYGYSIVDEEYKEEFFLIKYILILKIINESMKTAFYKV